MCLVSAPISLHASVLRVAEMVAAIKPVGWAIDDLSDFPKVPAEGIMRDTITNPVFPGGITATYAVNDFICVGCPFTITASITNVSQGAPPTITEWNGLIPTSPNISFVSAVPSIGVFNPVGVGPNPCVFPGIGQWVIGAAPAIGTTYTLVITCQVNAAPPVVVPTVVNVSSNLVTTASAVLCFDNTLTLEPSPTPNNYVNSVCGNSVLVDNVTASGGTPPYLFSIASFPPPGQGVLLLTDATTGAIQFTPNPSFVGVASFTFNVVSTGGPVNCPNCAQTPATGDITVLAYPTAAAPAAITTCSDSVVSGSVAPYVSGGTLPYTFSVLGAPVGGTVTMNSATGDYTFVQTPGFNGAGGFTYQVTGSNGCSASNMVSINFFTQVVNPYVTFFQILYGGSPCT